MPEPEEDVPPPPLPLAYESRKFDPPPRQPSHLAEHSGWLISLDLMIALALFAEMASNTGGSAVLPLALLLSGVAATGVLSAARSLFHREWKRPLAVIALVVHAIFLLGGVIMTFAAIWK